MIELLKSAIDKSQRGESRLTREVLGVSGFCGEKFKHLLNNLGAECKCYLEVGSLHGASLTATCYLNKVEAYAIENFSEFNGSEEVLRANAGRYAPQAILLLQDAFSPETLGKLPKDRVDLFFYDGCHSDDAHEKALAAFNSTMANEVIYLCDDWNWAHVKQAALRGLMGCGFDVVYRHEIATKDGDAGGYWNGVGAFVLKRKG